MRKMEKEEQRGMRERARGRGCGGGIAKRWEGGGEEEEWVLPSEPEFFNF
jgi:hypothetical protein